jgi:hypothetical protein
MKRDVLLYRSYQILDENKIIYHQGIPTLEETQIQLEFMAKHAESVKDLVERIDLDHIRINGTLFYIIDSTPRVQF